MIRPPELREEEDLFLGAPVRRREPNPELIALAQEYATLAGFPPVQETPVVEWDEDVCKNLAQEFESLPFVDESDVVREAYRALAQEISDQYDFLSQTYAFEAYGDGDPVPYDDSEDMMNDVRNNHHLWVYTGGEDHAYLSRDENYMFRAVHDLFGHAAQGFTFGPRGEENAWVEHSKLFTPLARAALTTETRLQNSWVNCGPFSNRPVKERPYADQKGVLGPEEYWVHPVVEEAYQDWPEFIHA